MKLGQLLLAVAMFAGIGILPVAAQKKIKVDGITYLLWNDQTAQLENGKKVKGVVEIPAKVEAKGKVYTVTRISGRAFEGNCGITEIRLPESIATIDYSTFRDCKYLQKAVLPASLDSIGEAAFSGCNNLTLSIPSSIKKIGRWALAGHVTITLPEGVTEIGKRAWGMNVIASDGWKGLVLPDGGKIDGHAFALCKSLRMILPNTVTRIQEYAFNYFGGNNPGFFQITLPESLKEIEEGAFNRAQLSEIDIPASVEKIESNAFSGSTVQKVWVRGATDVGADAFRDCHDLKEVRLSPAVNVYANAFRECGKLEQVEYAGVAAAGTSVAIGDHAFYACGALRSVVLPWTLTSIGELAFGSCEELGEVKGLHADIILVETSLGFSPFSGTRVRLNEMRSKFSFYALGKVNRGVAEWMQKKEFETIAQWKVRVTVENRARKVDELVENAKRGYIEQADKNELKYALGNYDADYETYPVEIGTFGKQYIRVPRNEAPAFKADVSRAKFIPVFGVREDLLAVTGLTVNLDGKVYKSLAPVNEVPTELALNLSPLDLNFGDKEPSSVTPVEPELNENSLDTDIPDTELTSPNTFAVIIGNEHYQRVAAVPYAQNDAKVFAAYCEKTLGLPAQNIRLYEDATFGTLLAAVDDIRNIAKAYKGDIHVLFYYAGHGIPDETNRSAYLLPVDADGQQKAACYSLEQLYRTLEGLGARSVCVFLDACFSGAQRGEGMLAAARGVAIKPKASQPGGNVVVFSAATGEETAYPYDEKGHGLFTYFLLKKLQETKGQMSLGKLAAYLTEQVQRQSVVVNRKPQTPTVVASPAMESDWERLPLVADTTSEPSR